MIEDKKLKLIDILFLIGIAALIIGGLITAFKNSSINTTSTVKYLDKNTLKKINHEKSSQNH